VYFTRAALLDNIVTPWLIAAFFFAASPRRSAAAAVAGAVSFAVAVLTKETALLYLPALALLVWQNSDRRNRRFGVGLFTASFGLLCSFYPLFALLNNELLEGPGHVSLEWAVRWQLSGRMGSGSIFDPNSTAHAVIFSWFEQDPVLPYLILALVVPGLLIRRTRVVAFAFAVQVLQLLRGGYLPYPYVIAMIPFAALTVAGVIDWTWQRVRRFERPGWSAQWRLVTQTAVFVAIAVLVVQVANTWDPRLSDLRERNRDRGKAQALAWVLDNVSTSDYIVVDDSLWVDLVRAGFPEDHVIWFTKLDVDKDVKIPGSPQWTGINYVVLDHQDELSLHLKIDGKPSKETLMLFPTLGRALDHSSTVSGFGIGLDGISVRRVDPNPGSHPAKGS
jgi:hypothetical protein